MLLAHKPGTGRNYTGITHAHPGMHAAFVTALWVTTAPQQGVVDHSYAIGRYGIV